MKIVKLIFLFIVIPWIANFFLPLLLFQIFITFSFFNASSQGTTNGIFGTVSSFVVLAVYYYALGAIASKNSLSRKTYLSQSIKQGFSIFRSKLGLRVVLAIVLAISLPTVSFLFSQIMKSPNEPDREWHFILIALTIGPFIEELFFRKVFFQYCEAKSISRPGLISAISFTLVHGYDLSLSSLVLLGTTFFFSFICLARIYSRFKNLALTIILHSIWNATLVVLGLHQIAVSQTTLILILASVVTIVLSVILLTLLDKDASLGCSDGSDQTVFSE